MSESPRALVIRCPGSNCDAEMVRAFSAAGAATDHVHIDALLREPRRILEYELVGFPGGFSYGDDIASGRALAMRVRERLYDPLRTIVDGGARIIGVCNGFQVLCQIGLLPGPAPGCPWPTDGPPQQTAALAENVGGCFVDRWIGIEPVADSVCVWTRNLWSESDSAHDALRLPIAHGEGRFVADDDVLDALEANGQVALRYVDNPNGSMRDIAGICDATGRIFGLMPHPDRFEDWARHPYWTRLPKGVLAQTTPGMRVFQNAVTATQPPVNSR